MHCWRVFKENRAGNESRAWRAASLAELSTGSGRERLSRVFRGSCCVTSVWISASGLTDANSGRDLLDEENDLYCNGTANRSLDRVLCDLTCLSVVLANWQRNLGFRGGRNEPLHRSIRRRFMERRPLDDSQPPGNGKYRQWRRSEDDWNVSHVLEIL